MTLVVRGKQPNSEQKQTVPKGMHDREEHLMILGLLCK